MACSLWALRTSGFWFLLAMISASEAPVIALWNFTARRVRFFVTSSCYLKRLLVSQSRNLSCTSEKTLIKSGFYAEACRRDWRLAKGDGSIKTSRTSTMISCCSVAASVMWVMLPSLQNAVQQQHITQTGTVHTNHPQPPQYVFKEMSI